MFYEGKTHKFDTILPLLLNVNWVSTVKKNSTWMEHSLRLDLHVTPCSVYPRAFCKITPSVSNTYISLFTGTH